MLATDRLSVRKRTEKLALPMGSAVGLTWIRPYLKVRKMLVVLQQKLCSDPTVSCGLKALRSSVNDVPPQMKFASTFPFVLLPAVGAQIFPDTPLAETMAVANHLPCCEDMPVLTSLGLLSQSSVSRRRSR